MHLATPSTSDSQAPHLATLGSAIVGMPIQRVWGRHSYHNVTLYLVPRAGSVLTNRHRICRLPAETARSSGITQIYEGTNQIQRVVMARQLLK